MENKKNNYGILIGPEGQKVPVINRYSDHWYNNKETAELCGVRFYEEEAQLLKEIGYREFYIFKTVDELNVIWFSDLGYEDNEYLGIYVPENIERITLEQKKEIRKMFKKISNYKNHEICYVPDLETYSFGSETIDRRHNAIFDIIGGMEDVQSFRSRKKMAKVLGRK